MSGLLSDIDDPRTQGLLGTFLSMLAASGPSPQRRTFGQIAGLSGMEGMRQYDQAKVLKQRDEESKRRNQVTDLQLQQAEEARRMRQELRDVLSRSYQSPEQQALAGGGGPTNENAALIPKMPGGFDLDLARTNLLRSGNIEGAVALEGLRPKAKSPLVTKAGDVLRDPDNPTRVLAQNPVEEKLDALIIKGPDGRPMVNPLVLQAKRDIAGAGASRQTTTVNAFEPASVAAQKEQMQYLTKQADALQAAPVALANIERAKKLVQTARPFVGSGADVKLAAVKFLNNNLGFSIEESAVRDAEELRSRIFFNIMDNLKKLDAQPSQLQQQIMMESLGKLGTDPQALPRVLDAFAETIRGKVQQHNKRAKEAQGSGVRFPFDPTIELEDNSDPLNLRGR